MSLGGAKDEHFFFHSKVMPIRVKDWKLSFALITGCFLFMCFDVNRKLLPRRKTKQRIFRNIFFVDSKIVKTCDELYQKVDVWPLVLRQQSARLQIRSSLCVHFQNLKKSKFYDECDIHYTTRLKDLKKCSLITIQ